MPLVDVAEQDRVLHLTLNDPATLNALSRELLLELRQAILIVPDRDVRCVLLTGAGRAFCSGANLKASAMAMAGDQPRDLGKSIDETYNPLVDAIRDLPVPIVTAVNGVAAGAGLSLALMGDLIVAADSASFVLAFRRIGLVPDASATYVLPRLIGKGRAMEMALLGEAVDAPTALAWGMVNRVVADTELPAASTDLARRLAEGPAALGATRRMIWKSLDHHWSRQLEEERDTQRDMGRTADFVEGVSAFLQKRPAAFTGR